MNSTIHNELPFKWSMGKIIILVLCSSITIITILGVYNIYLFSINIKMSH